MKRAKKLLLFFCVGVLLLFSGCNRPELTEAERHELCVKYADRVAWLRNAYYSAGDIFFSSPEWTLKMSQTGGDWPICIFQVVSVEKVQNAFEDDPLFRFETTVKIEQVLSGDKQHVGEELSVFSWNFSEAFDCSVLEGCRYVGVIDGKGASGLNYNGTFLVTEDNYLVSPFGCSAEEVYEIFGWDMPEKEDEVVQRMSHRYTGMSLSQFRRELEKLLSETESNLEGSPE